MGRNETAGKWKMVQGYGSPKSRVCHANRKDVALLNRLQAISAVDNIYFRESFPSDLLEGLRTERESQRPIREIDVRLDAVVARPDGKDSQTMCFSGVNVRLGRKFHFVKQTDSTNYRDYAPRTLPIRSQFAADLSKGFSKYIDNMVKKKRQIREGDSASKSTESVSPLSASSQGVSGAS